MTSNMNTSEITPLLKNAHGNTAALSVVKTTTETQTSNSESQLPFPKWAIHCIACAVTVLLQFSHTMTTYVMHQYSYYAYMMEQYPDQETLSFGSKHLCSSNASAEKYKQQLIAQKLTSEWNIYCSLATYIPAIFFSANLISYSDVYGRNLFFIVPFVGTLCKNLLCAVGIYFKLSMDWFILFYFIEGCTGFWISTLAMAVCVATDTTVAGKQRSFVIGLMEASTGIGMFLATFLSGYLIKLTGYLIPEVIAVGFTVMGLLLVLLVLPETLPESKRNKSVSLCKNIKRMAEFYTSDPLSSGNRLMFILLLVIFVMACMNAFGRNSVNILYQLGSPFCWDSVKIGWYGTIRTLLSTFGGLVMIKTFHYCTTDEVILLAGFVSTTSSLILEALAKTDTMMFLVPVIGLGYTVTMPMVRGIMSRMTFENQQGSLFASVAAVEAVFHLVSSVAISAIYNATLKFYKGFTFLIMAGYGVIGILLCIIVIIRQQNQKKQTIIK